MPKKGETLSLPKGKTSKQTNLIHEILNKPMVITIGSAGTGKTYIAAYLAAYMLRSKEIQKIIITRPTVPTGKSIGFFPGTLNEKMEPWVKPVMEILKETLGAGSIECHIKKGNIEIIPFETLRGRTFDDAFVILDEAQNTTKEEIKAFVTRIGENSKVVINGDITQSDLKGIQSGLSSIVNLRNASRNLKNSVGFVEFTSDDIVRSGLCKDWVIAFENRKET
jgi:phosphate starvation-inducible PhoH-like protein